MKIIRREVQELRLELKADFNSLRGDFRKLNGRLANATILGAYLAPILTFTVLADACGFLDSVKGQR